MFKKIKCNLCGKTFTPGNKPDGMPNGVGNEVLQKKLDKLCKRG